MKRLFTISLLLAAAGAAAAPIAGPAAPARICKLTSVVTPLPPAYTKALFTFEIWIDGNRIAQFDESSFREATASLRNLREIGICSRIDFDQRSDQPIP